MLLGVVSDSHGHVVNTLDALRLLGEFPLDCIVHCGDIGSPAIPPLLTGRQVHYVFGNVDQEKAELRRAIQEAGHQCHERYGELERAGRRIAFLHGDDERRLRDTIHGGEFDLVCYGHTHQAEHHRAGKTLVLNPGAIYRARPHSVAVVDLETMEVTKLIF